MSARADKGSGFTAGLRLSAFAALLSLPVACGVAPSKSGVTDSGVVACDAVGTWTGSLSCSALAGGAFSLVIGDGGTAQASLAGTAQKGAYLDGALNLSTADGGCASKGTLRFEFQSTCDEARLSVVSDPCSPRGACLSQLPLSRQKQP